MAGFHPEPTSGAEVPSVISASYKRLSGSDSGSGFGITSIAAFSVLIHWSPSGLCSGYRVAMKTMANKEAIAVRLQKIFMAQKQCRQNSSSHPMTIAALPTIT
jgi:hypothetical protein